MFQIGKLCVSSLTSTLGTSAIAANAVANTLSTLANIPGNTMSLAMIPVVGQCLGAGEKKQAQRYSVTLLGIAITGLAIVSDTTVAPIETVHGKVAFLQLVGLTQPELDALARDPDALDGILERMRADDPELVLDMRRTKSYV